MYSIVDQQPIIALLSHPQWHDTNRIFRHAALYVIRPILTSPATPFCTISWYIFRVLLDCLTVSFDLLLYSKPCKVRTVSTVRWCTCRNACTVAVMVAWSRISCMGQVKSKTRLRCFCFTTCFHCWRFYVLLIFMSSSLLMFRQVLHRFDQSTEEVYEINPIQIP